MCGTPDKSRIGHPVAQQYRHQALRNSPGSLNIRRDPPL
jgi:hypothetical protein